MVTSRRLLCPELIGREREIEALDALLAGASDARTLLIAGEAGVGKSALLRRTIERVRERGGRALLGSCTEIEARRPFGPFIEVLRQVADDRAASWLRPALRGRLAPLAALMPEATASTRQAEGTDRFRVYDAFVWLLTEARRSDVRVAMVEDLHWADEASLELFAYLARRLPATAVALVGSYRSDELHRTHLLRPVIVDLERVRTVDVIRLDALDRAGSDKVVRATLGSLHVPPDLLETVWERCQGNAFFIEETLRSLVEEGHLRSEDGGWSWSHPLASAVPASVRDAVQLRFARIAPTTLRLSRVAAVIGQRFDVSLLHRASGMPERDVVGAIGEMVEAQLVDERADLGSDAYAFRHALTREAVLAEVLHRDRRELHLRIATAIESELELPDVSGPGAARSAVAAAAERDVPWAADERAEELAYHFDEAGDTARAHHYHVRAGAAAWRSVSALRAVRHYDRAIELAPADPALLGRLYFVLAVSLRSGARLASRLRRR